MRVKIGTDIFDSNDMPIMLILSPEEKQLIADMREDNYKICLYDPSHIGKEYTISEFMKGEY